MGILCLFKFLYFLTWLSQIVSNPAVPVLPSWILFPYRPVFLFSLSSHISNSKPQITPVEAWPGFSQFITTFTGCWTHNSDNKVSDWIIMCISNITYNNLIYEKINNDDTFQNINGEKQEWAHQIAHFTIWLKKRKIMNKHFKILNMQFVMLIFIVYTMLKSLTFVKGICRVSIFLPFPADVW